MPKRFPLKKSRALLCILSISLVFISSCQWIEIPIRQTDDESRQTIPATPKNPISTPTPTPSPEPIRSYTQTATLVAVGDIMVHQPQIDNAYDVKSKTYDFTGYFRKVSQILKQGDWVVANLETTLAGADAGGYSGYPMFNSPAEIADALKLAGFTFLTTANNHSLDRSEKGVLRTLDELKKRGFLSTGTYATAEEAQKLVLVTEKEITIAFLAYAYGTNGIPFPQGKEYLVNLIDETKIIADIQKAREMGADLVSVSLHFGNEYQRMPSEQQVTLAHKLILAGADLILGSHPHVVQPIQWVNVKNKDGSTRRGLIVFSMGNFISSQMWDYKDVGVIVQIQVSKKFPEETVQIEAYQAIPTYVYRDWENSKRRLTILPLGDDISGWTDLPLSLETLKQLNTIQSEMEQHFRKMEPIELNHDAP